MSILYTGTPALKTDFTKYLFFNKKLIKEPEKEQEKEL
jgi:hypothetical protein